MPLETYQWSEQTLIEQGFSCDEIRHLQHMRQGDRNNKKGTFYEKMFTVYILLQILSDCDNPNNLPQTILSNREQAFVDDLTRIDAERHINYQLKNSDTEGHLRGKPLEKFRLQLKMDGLKYPEKSCISTLVCSDRQTVEKNLSQLPSLPDGQYFDSLFFPYHASFCAALTDSSPDWRNLLSAICPHETQYETALQIMASVFNDEEDWRMTIGEAWEKIIRAARPNIFSFGMPDLPTRFKDKCTDLNVSIMPDSIGYNGFNITLTETLAGQINQMSEADLAACHTAESLLKKLMCFAGTDW